MKNNEYPLINNYRRVAKVNTNDIDSYIGFADFTLKCPDIHIPILPVMNEKLKFPVGIIKGSYDFPSVKYAMDNGYELISAKNGIVFDNKFKPFKNYITDLYKKRMELKAEHNPVEIVVKLLMNGLYGKFALRYDNKEFLFTMNQLGYYVDNKNVDFTPITDTIFKGSTNEFSVIPNYVIPCFSSLTTAYARRYMHQQYKLTGFHRIYYTDTDCIFTDRVLETSNDLGALKIESEFLDLLLIKPKLYGGVTVDNKEKIKVKGVHKGIDGFKDFLSMVLNDNFTVKTEHWLKFKESIHKGEYCNKPGFITKTIDLQDDKRDWERLYFSTCPQDSNPLRFNYNDYKKI